ncbi:MAG TPA: transcriptional repressor NrdR [Firmicutes bacterium]|nr:transcriptional repressor NrdR [Bacillota bacterium]
MQCPYCGSDSKVLDSRQTEEGRAVRRRRECLGCMRRFTTYEKVEEMPLVVVKKDGRREPFEQSKIRRGILTACEKRPVSMEVVDELVHSIERDIRSNWVREVESRVIGEMVMDRLREIDEVAYVRFASVYRQFKDLERFREELERLLADR